MEGDLGVSLKKNIVANYVSQIYVTLIGIVMIPLYIRYMGAEAYGLVGFFAMLQAWFNLLDMGFIPTIARETSRFRAGVLSPLNYLRLYRPLSFLFFSIALLGGGGLWLLSSGLANRWLSTESLSLAEVEVALQVMAVSISLRWMGSLYRGVITGAEYLVWLSGFNGAIATLRFVVVLFSMDIWGGTPTVFFLHQLVVTVLEVAGLFLMCRRILPDSRALKEAVGCSFLPVQSLMRFAMTIAFASIVWIFLTQLDKLLLSGILSLTEYGYFTVAVLVANGIQMISGPISSAIMPRMVVLYAEGKHEELIRVYRDSTQWISALAGSAAITLVFCAEPLLFVWSGSLELAENAAPILQLYAVGNALLAIAAFPYYLQYAQGSLRYHFFGNVTIIILFVPCVIYAATTYGGQGAGWAWIGANLLYLLVWVGYVHHKLVPGLHWKWVQNDVVFIVLPVGLLLYFANGILFEGDTRVMQLLRIVLLSLIAIGGGVFFSSSLRNVVFKGRF